jgi:hypothetical protein
MFEIRIDGIEPLLAKFAKLEDQIVALQKTVPAELEAWQRDDMRRKYPNMTVETVNNETNATTYIWPTSRTPSARRRRFQRPKQHRPATAGPVVRSNRPILRAELLTQLWDRMTKLLAEAVKWP